MPKCWKLYFFNKDRSLTIRYPLEMFDSCFKHSNGGKGLSKSWYHSLLCFKKSKMEKKWEISLNSCSLSFKIK